MRRLTVLLTLTALALTGCTAGTGPARYTAATTPRSSATSTPEPAALPEHLTPPRLRLPVLATASGSRAAVQGTLRAATSTLLVTIVCQGEGFPTVHTSDGFTANSAAVGQDPPQPGAVCSPDHPVTSHYGLVDVARYGPLRYAITPHGAITWAVTFSAQD